MEHLINFSCIDKDYSMMEDNDFFTIFTHSSFPEYYDLNYMRLKYSPTLPEFLIIEGILKEYQFEQKQGHLNIIWPENEGIRMDVLDYLSTDEFKLGKQELMFLRPEKLHLQKQQHKYQMIRVNDENIDLYLTLNYKEDLQYGERFAEMKQEFYKSFLEQPNKYLLLAMENGHALGSMIIILSDEYIEIDHVLTDAAFRYQGVASSMVQFAIQTFNKPIILVVDAEDTPKEMYEKFGFEVVTSQINALKEKVEALF